MITVKEIYNFLDSFCPFKYCMDFDNVGLLIGNFDDYVKKILIALDVTDEVLMEAQILKANLIISHHPIIFNPLKKLYSSDIVYKAIKNNINVICAHTNLDMAKNGVNTALKNALNLKNTSPLSIYNVNGADLPLGIIGDLSENLSSEDFAKTVKVALDCDKVRFTNISEKPYIKKVALCSGAGGNLIYEAIKNNTDAFLTGEIKHHEILLANKNNITVVDTGHFKSENLIVKELCNAILKEYSNIEVYCSQNCTDKIKYI